MFFAHSTDRKDKSDWQRLQNHLAAVATLASERGEKFSARRAAALAGLLHDWGNTQPLSSAGSKDLASQWTIRLRELKRSEG